MELSSSKLDSKIKSYSMLQTVLFVEAGEDGEVDDRPMAMEVHSSSSSSSSSSSIEVTAGASRLSTKESLFVLRERRRGEALKRCREVAQRKSMARYGIQQQCTVSL